MCRYVLVTSTYFVQTITDALSTYYYSKPSKSSSTIANKLIELKNILLVETKSPQIVYINYSIRKKLLSVLYATVTLGRCLKKEKNNN